MNEWMNDPGGAQMYVWVFKDLQWWVQCILDLDHTNTQTLLFCWICFCAKRYKHVVHPSYWCYCTVYRHKQTNQELFIQPNVQLSWKTLSVSVVCVINFSWISYLAQNNRTSIQLSAVGTTETILSVVRLMLQSPTGPAKNEITRQLHKGNKGKDGSRVCEKNVTLFFRYFLSYLIFISRKIKGPAL